MACYFPDIRKFTKKFQGAGNDLKLKLAYYIHDTNKYTVRKTKQDICNARSVLLQLQAIRQASYLLLETPLPSL